MYGQQDRKSSVELPLFAYKAKESLTHPLGEDHDGANTRESLPSACPPGGSRSYLDGGHSAL